MQTIHNIDAVRIRREIKEDFRFSRLVEYVNNIHARIKDKGFWDDYYNNINEENEPLLRKFITNQKLMLIFTEISEAFEAVNDPIEEELKEYSDIAIRIMDLMSFIGMDKIDTIETFTMEEHSLIGLTIQFNNVIEAFRKTLDYTKLNEGLGSILIYLLKTKITVRGEQHKILPILLEKDAYNDTRPVKHGKHF